MAQSVRELTERVVNVDLWSESTNEDRCDNCKFYKMLAEAERGIGYCAHRDVDMVVGAAWWCKLWAPTREEEQRRSAAGTGQPATGSA